MVNPNIYKIADMKYVILMKIGYHGDESLQQIIQRKKNEDVTENCFFWGYGGSVCNPTSQVQPFVNEANKNGEKVHLLMIEIMSKIQTGSNRSSWYSTDNANWTMIPKSISVIGSKYALVCKGLYRVVNGRINLRDYSVGVGPSKGKLVIDYMKTRTDKACAILNTKPSNRNLSHVNSDIKIKHIAEVVSPYAVFLK